VCHNAAGEEVNGWTRRYWKGLSFHYSKDQAFIDVFTDRFVLMLNNPLTMWKDALIDFALKGGPDVIYVAIPFIRVFIHLKPRQRWLGWGQL
jgi:hypothetical protein